MYTLQHTGEIIAHPDTSAAYYRRQAENRIKWRCEYGLDMTVCPYADIERPRDEITGRKKQSDNCGRVCVASPNVCPRRQYLKDCGNKKKQFGITNKHYRDLANRMAYLKENAQNKVLFITLTFGEFKNANEITEQQANDCFSNFVDRLKKEHSR